MDGAYKFEQDNLILHLKNMQKPPISKELARELGFDPKKYETVINKLLCEISEVRKERIKQNLIFEEKLKSIQNNTITNDKNSKTNNIIKNNAPKNKKNIKLNLNRPKSNYKSVKSSGYGIAQKKINIFSSRPKKKAKDYIINKKNKNLIPKNSKSSNSINIKNNNYNSHNNKNKININEENDNNLNIMDCKGLINEIKKIENENKIIENRYQNSQNISLNPFNDIMNNKQQNKFININKNEEKDKNKFNINYINYNNNFDLINKNIDNISKNIIDELLYELVFDLKNIEDKKSEKQNNKKKKEIKQSIINSKIKSIENNFKYQSKINKDFVEKCNKNKNNFEKYMKLKGSFFINDIFKIYDDFVEEMSKLLLEQGLDYCIKQMDDFIKLMEKNNK